MCCHHGMIVSDLWPSLPLHLFSPSAAQSQNKAQTTPGRWKKKRNFCSESCTLLKLEQAKPLTCAPRLSGTDQAILTDLLTLWALEGKQYILFSSSSASVAGWVCTLGVLMYCAPEEKGCSDHLCSVFAHTHTFLVDTVSLRRLHRHTKGLRRRASANNRPSPLAHCTV